MIDGRLIKTSLGTTKYCSHFMKNQSCPKPDCMYLHELGDQEASFTKEVSVSEFVSVDVVLNALFFVLSGDAPGQASGVREATPRYDAGAARPNAVVRRYGNVQRNDGAAGRVQWQRQWWCREWQRQRRRRRNRHHHERYYCKRYGGRRRQWQNR